MDDEPTGRLVEFEFAGVDVDVIANVTAFAIEANFAVVATAEYVFVDGSKAVPMFSQSTSITVHCELLAQLVSM